jgi:predicted nucleic acid-binding protein
MKLALDTSVLVHAQGVNGATKQSEAMDLISRLPATDVYLPVQALGELFQVLVRKSGRIPTQARSAMA